MVTKHKSIPALSQWGRNALGSIALCLMAGSTSAQSYCSAGAISAGTAGITQVTFNTINNSSSSNPAYTNYTTQTTTVMRGETHALSVSIRATGSFTNNTAVAWIDWNRNGTFEASETYALGTRNSGSSGSTGLTSSSPLSITVPATALVGTTRMRIRTQQTGTPSACGNTNNSEAEDYTINVIAIPVCSGTPNPGNTTVDDATPCPGNSVTLDFQNHSTNLGLSYQWQSSTTGVGGPFASNGLGTATSQVTTPNVARWYRIAMTCSGNTGYSVPVLVTPSVSVACYCAPTASPNNSTGLTNVTFNTINNSSSGASDYTDYSAQSTQINKGSSYPLSVRVNTNGNNMVYVKAWIDWNQNGTFDASEEFNLGSVTNVTNGAPSGSPLTITVPSSALTGTTIMRVRARRSSAPTACGNQSYSEAEDYSINVTAIPVCSGTPNPGNTTVDNATPCPGNSVTLDFQNHSTDLGLSYQWQSSTTGVGGPFASNGLGTATSQVTTPTVARWYRIAMTCSGNTGYSAPVLVTPTVSVACYCAPTASPNNSTGLTNVTFNTINNSSTGPPAYTDYSAQSTQINQGSGYPLSVRVNTNGNNTVYVKAWIDWNQNGTFDASEEFNLGSVTNVTNGAPSGSPLTITVPSSALTGNTIMRVRARRSSAPTACGNQSYSEAEDYTVNVQPPPPCSGTPDPGITTVSNATPCAGNSVTLDFQNHSSDQGLSYQWQSSTTGNPGSYANNGLGTATSQVTTPNVARWYRIAMTCSGNTGYSVPVLVTPTVSAACYCTATASTDDNTGVTNVTFNTINNSSTGGPAYTDHSAISTTVEQGATHSLSVRVNTDGNYTVYVKAWFDWNQNGVFDASEEYNLGSVTNVSDGAPSGSPYMIQIPLTALTGNTIMRVRARYNSAPVACGNNTYSEAEDYMINVAPQAPCTGTPYPGNTTTSLTDPCPGADFALAFSNSISGSGVTYQWQSSTTGANGPFANNGLGTALTQVTNTTAPTWYRVVATCSGNSGESYPVGVTPNALAAACYCAATANPTDASGVTNVSFNTISNASSSAPGYTDFSSQSTTLEGGRTYALSVSASVAGTGITYVNVWIDWNRNGTFDASEKYDLGRRTSGTGVTTGSPLNITVPANAPGGRTIMRVRAGKGSYPSACGNMNNSEAEDYTINVIPVHNTCATAYGISCGESYPGTTTGVAPSMPANACLFNGAASTGGQNWWMYVATADETITLSTCGQASFDTRISIFTGADCNTLNCISLSDDQPGCVGGSSMANFNAVAGNTYWIAVHGAGAQGGTYLLTVSCSPICTPPSNDVCASAIALSTSLADGSGSPALFTNVCATVDAPTNSSGTMPVQGVWFTFNPGAYDHVLITLLDNGESSQYTASTLNYALFTGDCADMGANQFQSDLIDAAGTTLRNVTPNTDHMLLVFNSGGSGVAGSFGLLVEHAAPNDAAITHLISPEPGLYCGSTMAPKVTLLNNGDVNLTSVQITYGLSGGVNHTYNWTGNLAYGASVNVTLPTVTAEAGLAQTLTIATNLPNGMADGITANDSKNVLLDVGGEGVMVNIRTDANPGQISWNIYDEIYNTVASGGPYAAGQANTLISAQFCLSTEASNCYILMLADSYGDGLCCANGNGYWELRTPAGGLLLRDLFDGAVDGGNSPTFNPANPNYGFGHGFCLPAGPANIAPSECGIFDNMLGNKVYANKVTGASNYQFEFSDPDAGFFRRIARPYNYVHFWDMVTNPLTPGVRYFARVRTDRDGPMLQQHFGTGCEMGLGIPQVAPCTQLIQAPAYGHSCNEVRSFNTNNSFIYATPVQGASEYQFRITNSGEGYDQTFTRSTYILQLKWNNTVAPPLISGYTYKVQMNVKVNGIYSGFCTSLCNITINNSTNRPEASMVQTNGTATMWPNPVRDGQVNLNIDGLADGDQNIIIDIQDIYGKQVFAKEFGNSGERFNTILNLNSEIASGVYMVNITVNGERTVQRLSIIR